MFSVTLRELIEEFTLEEISDCLNVDEILITSADINRPGLQLAGYFEFFGRDRIQIIGKGEMAYLSQLEPKERFKKIDEFLKCGFPCLIIARGIKAFPEMIELANKYCIPLLGTKDVTSRFMSYIIRYLNVQLAPREIKHGVLVEVYGEGILILGESGVGKSETALEIVKRGHRLVADDVVEIRKVSDKTLVGTSPDIIRHFIEIRGVGILDVKHLYGVGSVMVTESINLVINLELWDTNKDYERLGLVDEYTEILGIKLPYLKIPVRPGRNLAIVVEVAAMNNKQKKMGYNAAKIMNERVMGEISKNSTVD